VAYILHFSKVGGGQTCSYDPSICANGCGQFRFLMFHEMGSITMEVVLLMPNGVTSSAC